MHEFASIHPIFTAFYLPALLAAGFCLGLIHLLRGTNWPMFSGSWILLLYLLLSNLITLTMITGSLPSGDLVHRSMHWVLLWLLVFLPASIILGLLFKVAVDRK